MKRILKITVLIWLFGQLIPVQAQFQNNKSRSELGVMIGGSSYIGDLNPYVPWREMNLAGGLIYRYNVHSRLALRANLLYGKVEGYDNLSEDALFVDRNLSFHTDIWELGFGLEFNYFPFRIGNDRYKGTAYVLAELGLFRMNPKTFTDDGSEVELQLLGTEGQGTSINSKGPYNLVQLCVPLGVGAKMSLGKKASINLEVGIRKTFTDYLDDVKSDTYVDPAVLSSENGPTSAALSNRSLSGSRYGRRGDSSNKDWYIFSGVMLTFKLGNPDKCWQGW